MLRSTFLPPWCQCSFYVLTSISGIAVPKQLFIRPPFWLLPRDTKAVLLLLHISRSKETKSKGPFLCIFVFHCTTRAMNHPLRREYFVGGGVRPISPICRKLFTTKSDGRMPDFMSQEHTHKNTDVAPAMGGGRGMGAFVHFVHLAMNYLQPKAKEQVRYPHTGVPEFTRKRTTHLQREEQENIKFGTSHETTSAAQCVVLGAQQ